MEVTTNHRHIVLTSFKMHQAAAILRPPRRKMTVSAVQGKITVLAEDGTRVGQWGGTECFLSRQRSLGACLVVRSSRHRRHEGTFFQLARLQRVLSAHLAQGKLTLILPHEQCVCTLFIETTTDMAELHSMAGVLQDRRRWNTLERNVASRVSADEVRGRPAAAAAASSSSFSSASTANDTTAHIMDMRIGGAYASGKLRDPTRAALENDDNVDKDPFTDSPQENAEGGEEDGDDAPPRVRRRDDDNEQTHLSRSLPTPAATDVWGGKLQSSQGDGGGARTRPIHTLATQTRTQDETTRMMMSNHVASHAGDWDDGRTFSWTREQRHALDLVHRGQHVFVTGAAGTGKTAWLRHLIHTLTHSPSNSPSHTDVQDRHALGAHAPRPHAHAPRRVAVTAATGMAARVLNATTVYAFGGIGRGEGTWQRVVERVCRRADIVRGWRECEVLIIDEIGVLPAHVFQLLDRVARAVRGEPSGDENERHGHRHDDHSHNGSNSRNKTNDVTKHHNSTTNSAGARSKPFGGIQLVVVGDFLQLPPVARAGEEVRRAFESSAWAMCNFAAVEFRTHYRQCDDVAFATCCDELRRGQLSASSRALLLSRLHPRARASYAPGMTAKNKTLCSRLDTEGNTENTADHETSAHPYHDTHDDSEEDADVDADGICATAILPRRAEVDAVNAARLRALREVHFERYVCEDYAATPGTDIDSQTTLPALLTLKVGAQVVLLTRLDMNQTDCSDINYHRYDEDHRLLNRDKESSPMGSRVRYTGGPVPPLPERCQATGYLHNGERGVVESFVPQAVGPAMPRVRFGGACGVCVVVRPVCVEVCDGGGRVQLSRTMLPLQLAWALTVHRVQGMTLPRARVYLANNFFEPGQLYVAISRVRTAAALTVMTWSDRVASGQSASASAVVRAFYHALFPDQGYGDAGGGGGGGREEEAMDASTPAAPGKRVRGECEQAAAYSSDT